MLQNKKIALGICGGIAAYKCAHLVRLLVKEGAQVRVVMTAAAAGFVTPQTLSVLSRNPVWTDFFDSNHQWHNHVELGEWADVLLMAPLTANTLAKMAGGQCDNVLMAVYLSARGRIVAAPAMDLEMYRHSSVTHNLEALRKNGVLIIPAEEGELASGLHGEGRMAEPEHIVQYLRDVFSGGQPLSGKKALVNAGPTYEAIDPVRYIGNRSSGKMGIALAEALSEAGAEVVLVLGPTAIRPADPSIRVIQVESSGEMYTETLRHFENRDITICSAAVADYRPAKAEQRKIKKKKENMTLNLVKTQDILAELGKRKKKGQLLAGFALETENLEEYAREKLKSKRLDLVVANLAGLAGSGIGADNNEVTLIGKNNKITKFELKSKKAIARDIVDYLATLINE